MNYFRLNSVQLHAITILVFLATSARSQPLSPDSTIAVAGTIALREVVITASRTERSASDLPGSVTLLDADEIARSPSHSADGILRSVPGFSLFRRSSSVVAHPTTQGVSLRGTGASGASRTLVLLDGMPLNDPFGGWVQWAKVRTTRLERIELVRGGSSHLWGNYALSGVISLVTSQPERQSLHVETAGGSGQTAWLDLDYANRIGATAFSIGGRAFTTGGYPTLRQNQRGAIDRNASSRHQSIRVAVNRTLSSTASIGVQLGGFHETRENGTPLTGNGTRSTYASTSLTLNSGLGRWQISTFWQDGRFNSTFSAQEVDRTAERPALDQFSVPSRALGASLSWLKLAGARNLLAAGVDIRQLTGDTNESYFWSGSAFTRRREAGGRQLLMGFFAQDVIDTGTGLQITLGGRADLWRNSGGNLLQTDVVSNTSLTTSHFPGQSRWILGPRIGLLYRSDEPVTFRASAYRTFRTPTLNELYRPFRVGNDITAANASLDSERLTGGEAGIDLTFGSVSTGVTGFWADIDGAVANLTIGSGPGAVAPCGFVPAGGVCRQRRNLGTVRSSGVESEVSVRRPVGSIGEVTMTVRHIYNMTRIRKSTDPNLIGNRIPQIPLNTVVLKAAWKGRGGTDLTMLWRSTGGQFEDEANTLSLRRYTLLDLSASRKVGPTHHLFITVENLLDATYSIGISSVGLERIGAPRQIVAGIRLQI